MAWKKVISGIPNAKLTPFKTTLQPVEMNSYLLLFIFVTQLDIKLSDGYKESGNYTLIDEYHGFSFDYIKISGGAQPNDVWLTVFGLIYATCLAIIGCLAFSCFSI
jgi:hypothetical protein